MITVFLPTRKGSERIKNKNTKKFAGIEGGLTKIKLNQLLKCKLIDKIILSTNDPEIIDIGRKTSNIIEIDERDNYLCRSETKTDELINYVPEIIKEGHVLWTHVTSPMFDAVEYDKAIKMYMKIIKGEIYDSLMTVNKIQNFLWDNQGPINKSSKLEKWPRTQTIDPIFEVNSAMFLNSIENYKLYKNRIGTKPFLLETEKLKSYDIDWPEDFSFTEQIYKFYYEKNNNLGF
jgi:CMP-N-acetylneuraminic acid synthetase